MLQIKKNNLILSFCNCNKASYSRFRCCVTVRLLHFLSFWWTGSYTF